jgi:hypothetical protein
MRACYRRCCLGLDRYFHFVFRIRYSPTEDARTDGLPEDLNCESAFSDATIDRMTDESKPEALPPQFYAKLFWSRYWKDVIGWTLNTLWLRVGILISVPVALAIERYSQAHTDWHTIRVTLEIYAAIIAAYMMGQLYATGKKLHAAAYVKLYSAYMEIDKLKAEIDKLSWPENRPTLIFDRWGEVPHDDPRASFHEVSQFYHDRRYYERGIFILNRGGDAHEIDILPIELTEGVQTRSSYLARIDAGSTGFAFISMDYQKNVRFKGDDDVWDFPKTMGVIEDKLNAVTVAQGRLAVEVGARYRDANGAWYLSWCTIEYRREQNQIVFRHTNHRKFGSKKPELTDDVRAS